MKRMALFFVIVSCLTCMSGLSQSVYARGNGTQGQQMPKAKAQTQGKDAVVYKYREYEEFKLDELDVGGEKGMDGDLSIRPRMQKEFQNQLPLRENFNDQVKKSMQRMK